MGLGQVEHRRLSSGSNKLHQPFGLRFPLFMLLTIYIIPFDTNRKQFFKMRYKECSKTTIQTSFSISSTKLINFWLRLKIKNLKDHNNHSNSVGSVFVIIVEIRSYVNNS